jgi:hypothetical protein
MFRIIFMILIASSPLLTFAHDKIAGDVTPSIYPPPPKSPDADDDVIIMEEDSDYQENEEEDSDTDSAEGQYENQKS